MKSIKIAAVILMASVMLPALSMAQNVTGSVQFPSVDVGVTSSVTTTPGAPTTTVGATTTAGTPTGTPPSDTSSNGGSSSGSRNLECAPSSQAVETGAPATIRLSGGNGTYSLSAPGYTVVNTQNNRFTFTYRTPGTKHVVVTSGNEQDSCTIEVTGTSLVPEGTSEADQVTVEAAYDESEDGNMMWLWILLIVLAAIGLAVWMHSRKRPA